MTPARDYTLGLVFTLAAGIVDAISFIELGGYFTAFVSGNTTQLGVALAYPVANALLPVLIVGLFFLGGFLGTSLHLGAGGNGPPWTALLVAGVICVSITLFAIGLPHVVAASILGLAMGAQNAILPMKGAARPGATFVSGSLFGASQDLARRLFRQAPAGRWLQHLGIWAGLLVGAAAGSALHFAIGWQALVLPAMIFAVSSISLRRSA
jgi:uncharacterized membrane protein YoaK (UPF0700 family)